MILLGVHFLGLVFLQPDVTTVHRERHTGHMVTWTVPGFARVKDGAGLVFTIENIPYAMEYDIMIRYEPEVCSWDFHFSLKKKHVVYMHAGGTVVQWLALLPQNQTVLGTNLTDDWSLSVHSLHVLPMCSTRCSGFLS